MQEEADFEIGRAKIVVQLPFGIVVQPFSGLDFHHEFVVHHHVEPLLRDLNTTVADGDSELSSNAVAAR